MNEREALSTTGVRNYALLLLLVVYTFNFIDRQILTILMEPIKADLGLSDSALGLITGFAFALFYATLGIPIARYADGSNRRNLIAIALSVWSLMTALCGIAQNFWHLLIARIGVAVGEAGCSPPSHSIIADYFPPEKRATALGIYSLGLSLGMLFGLMAGGWLNEIFGWRMAFFVVGVPGVLLALVVRFTLKEPPRGFAERRTDTREQPSIASTFAFLLRKPTFRHMVVGASLLTFVYSGVVTWAPSFLIRSYGMSTVEVGTYLGLILGIPGGIGIVLGGYLADRLGQWNKRWYLWIVAFSVVPAVPLLAGVFLASSATSSLLLLIVPIMLGNFFMATTFSQTQGLVKLRMRAVAAAILLFIVNVIGVGAGPQLVGIISDLLWTSYGDESLRYSLLIFSFINLWGAWHYYLAGKHLEADLVAD